MNRKELYMKLRKLIENLKAKKMFLNYYKKKNLYRLIK